MPLSVIEAFAKQTSISSKASGPIDLPSLYRNNYGLRLLCAREHHQRPIPTARRSFGSVPTSATTPSHHSVRARLCQCLCLANNSLSDSPWRFCRVCEESCIARIDVRSADWTRESTKKLSISIGQQHRRVERKVYTVYCRPRCSARCSAQIRHDAKSRARCRVSILTHPTIEHRPVSLCGCVCVLGGLILFHPVPRSGSGGGVLH